MLVARGVVDNNGDAAAGEEAGDIEGAFYAVGARIAHIGLKNPSIAFSLTIEALIRPTHCMAYNSDWGYD